MIATNLKHFSNALYDLLGKALGHVGDGGSFVDPPGTSAEWGVFASSAYNYVNILSTGQQPLDEGAIAAEIAHVIRAAVADVHITMNWDEFADRHGAIAAGTVAALLSQLPRSSWIPSKGDFVEVHWTVDDGWQLCEVVGVGRDTLGWIADVVRVDGEGGERQGVIRERVYSGWRPSTVRRCSVKDCANRSDQGAFRGNLCEPCSEFLSGRGDRSNSSQAYRNHVAFARELYLKATMGVFDDACEKSRSLKP